MHCPSICSASSRSCCFLLVPSRMSRLRSHGPSLSPCRLCPCWWLRATCRAWSSWPSRCSRCAVLWRCCAKTCCSLHCGVLLLGASSCSMCTIRTCKGPLYSAHHLYATLPAVAQAGMPLARLMHDFGHCVVARELFQVRVAAVCSQSEQRRALGVLLALALPPFEVVRRLCPRTCTRLSAPMCDSYLFCCRAPPPLTRTSPFWRRSPAR